MKQILFLCHRIPYPPNKGDKIRSFNILKYLAENNSVSLGCLIDDTKDIKYVDTLKQYAEEIFYDQIAPRQKKIQSTALAFVRGESISVPYFYSKRLQNQLDNHLDENSFDTVVCSSSPSAEYIFRSRHYQSLLSNVQLVMDFIDMDSQKWQQYGERERFPLSFIYKREARYLLEYEKKIAHAFDRLLIVSEAEKHLFQSLIQTGKLHAVSNGVDLEFFNPMHSSKISLNSPSLVFTGAMDYWPNIEGAIWFVDQVLPQIKKHFPQVSLYLVGSNPSAELKALKKVDGVIVTGFVDDIRDYIAQADICVMPLRIARGIQNKVLEAMAMGKAVVSTPQAAEGLQIDLERDLVISEEVSDFAEAVLSILNNKQLAMELGKNARKAMEANYSWGHNLEKLNRLLDGVNLNKNAKVT